MADETAMEPQPKKQKIVHSTENDLDFTDNEPHAHVHNIVLDQERDLDQEKHQIVASGGYKDFADCLNQMESLLLQKQGQVQGLMAPSTSLQNRRKIQEKIDQLYRTTPGLLPPRLPETIQEELTRGFLKSIRRDFADDDSTSQMLDKLLRPSRYDFTTDQLSYELQYAAQKIHTFVPQRLKPNASEPDTTEPSPGPVLQSILPLTTTGPSTIVSPSVAVVKSLPFASPSADATTLPGPSVSAEQQPQKPKRRVQPTLIARRTRSTKPRFKSTLPNSPPPQRHVYRSSFNDPVNMYIPSIYQILEELEEIHTKSGPNVDIAKVDQLCSRLITELGEFAQARLAFPPPTPSLHHDHTPELDVRDLFEVLNNISKTRNSPELSDSELTLILKHLAKVNESLSPDEKIQVKARVKPILSALRAKARSTRFGTGN